MIFSLCNFLHISKHNLKRNNLAYSIDQQYIEMFYNLIDQELMIE